MFPSRFVAFDFPCVEIGELSSKTESILLSRGRPLTSFAFFLFELANGVLQTLDGLTSLGDLRFQTGFRRLLSCKSRFQFLTSLGPKLSQGLSITRSNGGQSSSKVSGFLECGRPQIFRFLQMVIGLQLFVKELVLDRYLVNPKPSW